MLIYIITGYVKKFKTITSISHTFNPKANQLMDLQSSYLDKDMKIGYLFYILMIFHHNSQIVHNAVMLSKGNHQPPYRTRSKLGTTPPETSEYMRNPHTLQRQTIAHLELHQSVVKAHTFNAALPKQGRGWPPITSASNAFEPEGGV